MRLTKQVLSELGNGVTACSDIDIWSPASKLMQSTDAEGSSNPGTSPAFIPVIRRSKEV